TDPDGTVRGEHPDGARSALPPGVGLDGGTCTCAATGICRHLLALVLAYQRLGAAPTSELWSPGEFTDEALEEFIGARQLTAAPVHLRPRVPAPGTAIAACRSGTERRAGRRHRPFPGTARARVRAHRRRGGQPRTPCRACGLGVPCRRRHGSGRGGRATRRR